MKKLMIICLLGLSGLAFSSAATSGSLWSHIYQNQAGQGISTSPTTSAPWQKAGIAENQSVESTKVTVASQDSAPWSHIYPSIPVVDIAVMEIVPEKK